MADYDIFELGDVVLQSGAQLREAKLAYKTYGKLSPKKDNVIIFHEMVHGLRFMVGMFNPGVGRGETLRGVPDE